MGKSKRKKIYINIKGSFDEASMQKLSKGIEEHMGARYTTYSGAGRIRHYDESFYESFVVAGKKGLSETEGELFDRVKNYLLSQSLKISTEGFRDTKKEYSMTFEVSERGMV